MPIDRTPERPRLPYTPDPDSPDAIVCAPRSRMVVAVVRGNPETVVREWERLAEEERKQQ